MPETGEKTYTVLFLGPIFDRNPSVVSSRWAQADTRVLIERT